MRAGSIFLVLLACAAGRDGARTGTAPLSRVEREVHGSRIVVTHGASDAHSAAEIVAVLPAATARAQRWGRLPAATIVVHESDESFGAAIGDTGRHDRVRAWTRYDVIHLRPPRSWGAFGASRAELERIVGHELVHSAMYQRIGDRATWGERPIPFWLREGMALDTPDAGQERAIRDRLRSFETRWRSAPGQGALAPTASQLREHPDLAYGVALVAFRTFVVQHGAGAVGRLLDRVGTGEPFPDAFAAETGTSPEAFEAGVRRAIVGPR